MSLFASTIYNGKCYYLFFYMVAHVFYFCNQQQQQINKRNRILLETDAEYNKMWKCRKLKFISVFSQMIAFAHTHTYLHVHPHTRIYQTICIQHFITRTHWYLMATKICTKVYLYACVFGCVCMCLSNIELFVIFIYCKYSTITITTTTTTKTIRTPQRHELHLLTAHNKKRKKI